MRIGDDMVFGALIEEVRFATDSALEGTGFEPVWGFSCQVVFGLLVGSLFPLLGRAELHLQIAEEDIDLARCKGAVALVVSHGREATVYWLYGGLCEDVEFIPSGLFVQGRIEARCFPDGYELPPQMPDLMPAKAETGRP